MSGNKLNNSRFTVEGRSQDEIKALISEYRGGDFEWSDPRNLKAAYNAGPDVSEVAWDAYTAFRGDNLLYGKLMFPSLLRMGDEVVGKVQELLGDPEDGAGTITSGGTESIILAVKTARDRARSRKPISGTPEIVLPATAHAAFNKAAEMLGLNVRRVAVDETFRVIPEAVEQTVTANTIMVVGSAPAYPIGSVDPITELGEIALAHDLWLHVDACVGGFFLPFAADLGFPVTPFDFSVPGVRSMSVDLHKYGYTSRGASVLLLRDKTDLEFQKFFFNDWPTGEFITTTIAGSRPGGAIASAWAVLNYLGFSGYRDRVEKIIMARDRLVSSINAFDDVQVLGRPEAGIVGIAARGDIDMASVNAGMSLREWKLGPLATPRGMNILLNYTHGAIVDDFVADLATVIRDVRAGRLTDQGTALSYGG